MVEARALYRAVKARLEQGGIEDAAFEAGLLLEKATGLARFDTDLVPEAAAGVLEGYVARRLAREPLQYILGEWQFMGLALAVGPGVLIPRPETEEVCLAAIHMLDAKGKAAPRVLDLCAGSGALALGVQQAYPFAEVTAVEWSPEAFAWCEKNCAAYARAVVKNAAQEKSLQGNKPKPVRADVLEFYKTLEAESVDLIVSNPPYVTAGEFETLEKELYHEPRMALVAEEEGLLFYKRIAADYARILRPGGALVFEIGAGQGHDVQHILEENGYRDAEIVEDINGNVRIAKAYKL